MKVYNYETANGKDLIYDYISKLSTAERIDGMSVLEKFTNDEIDELRLKHWRGKVWEVNFYKHNRIFYVAFDEKEAYMLHACRKQKNRTEKNDSDIVTKRAKELGMKLSKKII